MEVSNIHWIPHFGESCVTKQRRDTSRQAALTCWLLTTHYIFGAGPTQLLFHLPRQLVTGAGVSAGEVRRHAGQWDLCLDTATLTGRGGAGRGGWPLWHCAGPRAGHQHPAVYPRYPRPDTRAMRCFLMLRVALLVLLMPRVRGQDVRNKLLHGKTDETTLYGKETGNENMWQIALKYLKFVQTLKFCQSPPTFEYANHRSHHFTILWRLFRALYNKKYICIYVAHNFNNVRKSQYVNIWSKFWVLPLGRSIHNGYTFSMFSIEFSRFPPHYCIQDPMAASGEISPKLGKCPLPPHHSRPNTNDHGPMAEIGFHWFHS